MSFTDEEDQFGEDGHVPYFDARAPIDVEEGVERPRDLFLPHLLPLRYFPAGVARYNLHYAGPTFLRIGRPGEAQGAGTSNYFDSKFN